MTAVWRCEPRRSRCFSLAVWELVPNGIRIDRATRDGDAPTVVLRHRADGPAGLATLIIPFLKSVHSSARTSHGAAGFEFTASPSSGAPNFCFIGTIAVQYCLHF